MNRDQLSNEYFEWMYNLVCSNGHYNKLSYRKLLTFLHNVEFTYIIELDENRVSDGIDFRYRFGYENGYSREDIAEYLDFRPCSVFEMMVSLAFRLEEQIMDDSEYGNRTGQWFWNMLVSLGLGKMSDRNFDKNYVRDVLTRFLNNDYAPNGEGGLFTVSKPKYDMRDTEIWCQAMWYLNEVIDG